MASVLLRAGFGLGLWLCSISLTTACGDDGGGSSGGSGSGATGAFGGGGATGGAGGSGAGTGGVISGGGAGGSGGGSGGGAASGGGGTGGGGGVARPSYNTGTGFFTFDGKLYDANGVEFRIKGANRAHYDIAPKGAALAKVNAFRLGTPLWSGPGAAVVTDVDAMIQDKIVPILGVWFTTSDYSDAGNVTCKPSKGAGVTVFDTAVSQWVAWYPTYKSKGYEKYMLLNIANEWGSAWSAGDTSWLTAYQAAVDTLRKTGFLATLVIDAGGCGQDSETLIQHAQALYDHDPQHNILFDLHIYGNFCESSQGVACQSWQKPLAAAFDGLKATSSPSYGKLPFLIGEFGPGKGIGPSPTTLTPGYVIQQAEARGFGWLAWAWDDNNLANCSANDQGFGMLTHACQGYATSADLTAFGKDVIETPSYGTKANAVPATIF